VGLLDLEDGVSDGAFQLVHGILDLGVSFVEACSMRSASRGDVSDKDDLDELADDLGLLFESSDHALHGFSFADLS